MIEGQTIEVAALSWIVELPRDLGLEENLGPQLMNNRVKLKGWKRPITRSCRNGRRVRPTRCRSNACGSAAPMSTSACRQRATDITFGDLRRLEGPETRAYEKSLRKRIREGTKEWKTVCQMTRWYAGDSVPDPPEDPLDPERSSPIRTDFVEMLGDLDLWLQAYG